ncbi:CidA/LrgA family protein [bacterium]|nr:CidA/LrgA family protein [bacterium]
MKFSNIPFPAPILGIIVMFLLLQLNFLKREWIKDICDCILKYMPLLFVPLAVGIITYYGVIEKNLIPILINVVVTTTLTLLLTAIFVENVIKFVRLQKMRKLKND